jgi:prevent-host-death family protein
MPKRLSLAEDIVPIGEFKTHASEYVRRVRRTQGPVVITQNGRAAAVVVSAERYQELEDREAVREAIRRGLVSAERGPNLSLDEVAERLRARVRNVGGRAR